MPRVDPPISVAAAAPGLIPAGHDDVAAVVGVGLCELAPEPLRAAHDDDGACRPFALLLSRRRGARPPAESRALGKRV